MDKFDNLVIWLIDNEMHVTAGTIFIGFNLEIRTKWHDFDRSKSTLISNSTILARNILQFSDSGKQRE